jgi:hypothetical protein
MSRSAWLALLALLGVPPAAAQTVVRPAAPLDSSRAALRNALVVLRDSLITIDAAAARLQRDFRTASAPSLLSRAGAMRQACSRSVRTIPSARAALQAADLTHPRRRKLRQDLVTALDSLKGVLRYCETEFSAMSRPGQAEVVRGYGNDRAGRVQAGLRSYERHLRDFTQLMGIRVPPAGVPGTPSAG